jgi:serine/threonine protein kinase
LLYITCSWHWCIYCQLSGRLLTAYGYGAPEFDSGSYTHQSDVYSFGVVMLELLTGRKSYDRLAAQLQKMHMFCTYLSLLHNIPNRTLPSLTRIIWSHLKLCSCLKIISRSRPRGEQFLVRWAIPQLHDIDALAKMVDPSLKGGYPIKSLSRFADIISSCVQVRVVWHSLYYGCFDYIYWFQFKHTILLQREPEFRPSISEIVQELLQMI